ncbi:MAG: exodeoxyribonuclease large subunit [Bacteroidota bacterium]
MSSERQIFTLQQVVQSIRKTIEDRYTQSYWIKAEMHKLNQYPSGHAFPELVQKENDKIVAQIGATIWRDNLTRINKAFAETVKEPLKEGVTLLMQVKIVFTELYGLGLQVLDIDPNFTLGELQREREETLKKLQKEGLLNANQQLTFPLLPKRIAVISADSSKGLSDFNKVLLGNSWNYTFFTMLFQAYLQGDMAVPSILAQLERIRKVAHHFDVVVIVRGGGGEVGMSCYNNYLLCKAIASFPLPVLTGIGHSTNLTVAEMVAFRNAITPTELADFLIQAFHEFAVPVQEATIKVRNNALQLMQDSRQLFTAEVKHFKNAAELFLSRSQLTLTRTTSDFRLNASESLNGNSEKLKSVTLKTNELVQTIFKAERESLNELQTAFPSFMERKVAQELKEIKAMEDLVRVMDPANVLRRGYSLVRLSGKTIQSGNMPVTGDQLEIETEKLIVKSTVQSVNLKED